MVQENDGWIDPIGLEGAGMASVLSLSRTTAGVAC